MTINDSRWQLKNTNFLAIDWSSISDINRLIVIDWYLLPSIVIDYRFHRLITPGLKALVTWTAMLVGERTLPIAPSEIHKL